MPSQSFQNGKTLGQFFEQLYTPTLSALIESRKPGLHSFEKPPILLVTQPDEFMPKAWDEISLIHCLNRTVTTLVSEMATPSAVLEHLQDHRFAHFSCHGILETGKPFDASFKLYQGQCLTLLDIIRSRLRSAEFAFLSACHMAELTGQSIADEAQWKMDTFRSNRIEQHKYVSNKYAFIWTASKVIKRKTNLVK
jgi:hypothetical protein